MNADFMRLLAQRLERVPWVDARLAECTFPDSFGGVDGFFMGADLMRFEGTGEVFAFRNWRVGSIDAWAGQLIQEQGGFHDEDNTWVAAKPYGTAVHEVRDLAFQALGLGRVEHIDEDFSCLVLDGHVADALLSPSFLHGRMRGIGPQAVAGVLNRCADGMAPLDAWAVAAQKLRESRLQKLAEVLESAPHAGAAAWHEATPAWSSHDLDRLTHFSMLSRYRPSAMPDGAWCGDLAMWVWKLYGADAEFYFGKQRNVGLAASIMLGLTPFEGSALFEADVSPSARQDFNEVAFCLGLTPDLAADAVQGVAEGVFPSFMWDHLQDEVGLDDWMEAVLGYRIENWDAPSSNGENPIDGETHDDDDDD